MDPRPQGPHTMRLTPTLLLSAALLGVLLAHGCSTVSSSVMVPEAVSVERTVGGSVRIDAEGTDRQGIIGKRLIDPEQLTAALRESVLVAGVFDEVVTAGSADHVLSVHVERLDEPELGLDMSCQVAMRWQLQDSGGTRIRWEELVTTKETITTFDKFDVEDRAGAAVAGALRANVRRGIERMSSAMGTGQ